MKRNLETKITKITESYKNLQKKKLKCDISKLYNKYYTECTLINKLQIRKLKPIQNIST